MLHPVLAATEAALGASLEHHGELELLDLPRRTLLVSRGERAPSPDTPWLVATVATAEQTAAQSEVLVTGAGRVAFDAALWTCARANGSAIVALSHAPRTDAEWRSFLPARHLLVWPRHQAQHLSERHQRDLLMGWLADRAHAIYVRKKGHMAELMALLARRRCAIEQWPELPGAGRAARQHRGPQLSLPRSSVYVHTSWNCLTHFTREPDGAWPGESRAEYLRWLCSGAPYVPRNAFATLCRILQEKRVRACGRLMPGSTPMVCFTAASPREILLLREWRRGLLRWSFTPYGLAVRAEALARYGAQPVQYASRAAIAHAPPGTRRFMQHQRSRSHDWSEEEEWRVAGDVDLSAFAISDMLALVATPEEARHVEDVFGISAQLIA
ncbi:MAG: hypothetical protein NTW87_16160 [Planctomycetota bacterium]|nr:hypothetical protein [Planctomycetota bacterium]